MEFDVFHWHLPDGTQASLVTWPNGHAVVQYRADNKALWGPPQNVEHLVGKPL